MNQQRTEGVCGGMWEAVNGGGEGEVGLEVGQERGIEGGRWVLRSKDSMKGISPLHRSVLLNQLKR